MKVKLLRKVRKYYDWNLHITDRKLSTCALIHKKSKCVTLCKGTDELMWCIALWFGKLATYHEKRERRNNMRLFKKYGKSKH